MNRTVNWKQARRERAAAKQLRYAKQSR